VESNTKFVAVTRMGAACLGARSAWTSLSATGANHALGRNPALVAGTPDTHRAAFRPVPAPMTQLAPMSAEQLPIVNLTRKQTNVHKTRIDAGGYGAMGPHPEREQPA
jgi:hypothetical protein